MSGDHTRQPCGPPDRSASRFRREVIHDRLRRLIARDAAIEKSLAEDVVPTIQAIDAGTVKTRPLEETLCWIADRPCVSFETFPARGIRVDEDPELRLVGCRSRATMAFRVRERTATILRIIYRGRDVDPDEYSTKPED